MTVEAQIKSYIAGQPATKKKEIEELHKFILKALPKCKLWFLDGRNPEGKIVSNPNIGYGSYTIRYADGKTKEFYQVGLSANTTGISVYILGIDDKTYLANSYGKTLGKATVTGYCIKFKRLDDLDMDVLAEAIRDGAAQSGNK